MLVNQGFLGRAESELAKKTLALLRRAASSDCPSASPCESVKKFRNIRIWVEEKEPHHPCMIYHPNAEWLTRKRHEPRQGSLCRGGQRPQLPQVEQGAALDGAHELAHGYHHQFLDMVSKTPRSRPPFDRAMKAKLYESVRGTTARREAYAATNPMEYFAEASEAYFGTNDFYPFVRAELKRHDPEMFRLLEKLWHPVADD